VCILYAHTRSFVTLAVKNDREHGKVVRALHINMIQDFVTTCRRHPGGVIL